jgi:pantoate--beta-alanine ligase
MNIANSVEELRAVVAGWRRAGETISFVPTMGNLHDGHITLLLKARELATRSVVSIFVNPIQFGRGEDYAKYPSTLESDKQKLQAAGLDLLFAPDLNELYPGGIEEDTRVTVPGLSSILCGQYRTGHFSGVATVVTKLLMNVQPDLALFGDKDYQQLMVIKQMVHDLLMPVKILGQPIVREADGLAMSSRNRRLSADLRAVAAHLPTTMARAAARILAGGDAHACAKDAAGELSAKGFGPIDYVELRDAATRALAMAPPARLFAAAHLGGVRLIDNIAVG